MEWTEGVVRSKRIWSPGLFTMAIEAPEVQTFEPGQFLQLGIERPEGQLHRPYSVASPPGDLLEFFIVLVETGQLIDTSLVANGTGSSDWCEQEGCRRVYVEAMSGCFYPVDDWYGNWLGSVHRHAALPGSLAAVRETCLGARGATCGGSRLSG